MKEHKPQFIQTCRAQRHQVYLSQPSMSQPRVMLFLRGGRVVAYKVGGIHLQYKGSQEWGWSEREGRWCSP